MLWRTTIVVAISAVLVIGCFAAGSLYRQAYGLRAKFLAYMAPALVIVAISGVVGLYRGQTQAVFKGAAKAQEALEPFDVVSVARWAWWCACLAVVALAVLAAASYALAPSLVRVYSSRAFASVTALVVLVVVVTIVLATGASAVPRHMASRIDAPTLTAVTGKVAYRIGTGDSVPVPSGAGFARVVLSQAGFHSPGATVEGYDGATGKRRWFYGPVDDISIVGSTGVGPDSVVLAISRNMLIGIDATTGALLWFKPGEKAWNTDEMAHLLSSNVILAVSDNLDPLAFGNSGTLWQALSPRTGEVLWTKTFGYHCDPSAQVTSDVVLVRSCETAQEDVADVLDAGSGRAEPSLTLSMFGVKPGDNSVGWASIDAVRGERALLTVGSNDNQYVVNVKSRQVVRRIPESLHADGFIDDGSVSLTQFRGTGEMSALLILNLATGEQISGGFTASLSSAFPGMRGASLISRAGGVWWTFGAVEPGPVGTPLTSPLRSVDDAGVSRSFTAPCPASQYAPDTFVIPGALLVDCSNGEWLAVA